MSIQLGILIVYVVVLIGISWWSTKLQKKASGSKMLSYLLAGRNMPAVVICVMLVGLAVGGASTVGVAETAYNAGFSAGWYNAAWGMGGIAVGLFVAKFFRKMSVKTIPEMMGLMFGPKTRFLSVVNQLLVMISITALQYVAGGSILKALLPDIFTFQGGLITTALIFIFITVVGGYWASGLTNIINVVMIYIGIIAALINTLGVFGGMEVIKLTLPPPSAAWFHPISGLGIAVVAGYVAVMVTMAITTQAVAQISFAAKDEKTAKWGFLAGGLIILPAGFLCAFFGIIARSQFPNLENAAMALPTIAAQLSPFVGGIFLASLWAADISTAVALLMGCSTLVLEDIVKKVYTKPIKKEHELLVSRLTVLGVSLLSFLLALTVVGILRTITTALAITTSFTLLILSDIYFHKLNRKASGFWIVLLSLLLWVVWTYLPQFRIGPALIYMEWVGCGALFILFAIFAKEPANRLVPQVEK
ncbi:sodium:solute symporter family protein [Treponema primitia]|uniref:sodium:solute symporter family protein n=1 Tax=Treponema primitia TaxID=88058 RepID=UPI0002555438|nr:sodium:solute symporter family protein [Treponema primitia]